ncbi:hypothetical protein [Candidatus Palauibacter sp.]|uniref:hypothetical protein n=1 Tax=Candidatus Palauibacter sp. TaxID=3101350 RepID=UPI003B5B3455
MRFASVIGSVLALTIGVLPALAQTRPPSGSVGSRVQANAPQDGAPAGSYNDVNTVGRVVRVDVSVGAQLGDRIRGPVTLILENINILRYDVQLRQQVTVSDVSNYSGLPFVPAIRELESGRETTARDETVAVVDPVSVDQIFGLLTAGGAPAGEGGDSVSALANTLVANASQAIENLTRQWDSNGRQRIADITRSANEARHSVLQTIGQSDLLLQTGQGSQLKDEARITLGQIDNVLEFTWPDSAINRIVARLETTKASLLLLQMLQTMQLLDAWLANDNRNRLERLLEQIDELTAEANTARSNSETADSLAALQRRFREIRPILDLVANRSDSDPDPFSRTIEIDCDRSDGRGREVQVELVRTERTDAARAAPPTVLATVECWSPFSISAGWGMSRLGHDEALTPLPPVMLVHAELLRIGRTGWALNLSSGASVGLPVGEEGGDLEYLLGGSFSVSRDLFVSGLVHFTTVKSGDPNEQDGTTRFALAVSYRVK